MLRTTAVIIAIVTVACRGPTISTASLSSATAKRVANLRAFARLYGVVRWFHPSDSAAAIDWEQFAVDGVHRVADAADHRALREALNDLFAPTSPMMHIIDTNQTFPTDPAPGSTKGLEVVAWEHNGYGNSIVDSDYASKRRHRDRIVNVPGTSFAALSQSVDAAPYRGMHVRLRGKLRAADHGDARLWLRVDRGDARGFFDNMIRRPVMSSAWSNAEITATVDPDATALVFGVLMLGTGTTWYDDLELSAQAVDGTWRAIEIRDGGFERSLPQSGWHTGTGKAKQSTPADGWNMTLDNQHPASGVSSLRVERATRIVKEELFDDAPVPGQTYDIDLGSGLSARVPIALYSIAGHTIGDDPQIVRRSQAMRAAPSRGFDLYSGIADVIIVWNVLKHFWPYWDMIKTDWDSELDATLTDALDDHDVDDHISTLDRLTVTAPDGHTSTVCPGSRDLGFAPFATDLIEGHVVVTASEDATISPGDVIISVDGEPAAQVLARNKSRISGSHQWQLVQALQRFGSGAPRTVLTLVVRRGNAEVNISATRSDHIVKPQTTRSAIERLGDGIYYIDLSRASMDEIDANIERLADAPGIIFDLRDRPNDNHMILSHLLTQADHSKWMAIPHIVLPDSASKPSSWGMEGWDLPVSQPHIGGRVVFLTGPRAISYSESVMGLVEYYHLGEIVGESTAGSNGDIAEILLPTGCNTFFTGRRVTKPDGSRHYLIGIQPTIPVSRTIAGVLAGRDEVLERALDHVRPLAR